MSFAAWRLFTKGNWRVILRFTTFRCILFPKTSFVNVCSRTLFSSFALPQIFGFPVETSEAWSSPWKASPDGLRKKLAKNGHRKASPTMLNFVKIQAGKLRSTKPDAYVVNRDALCVDSRDAQLKQKIFIRIYLAQEALDRACEKTQLAYLFKSTIC